MTPRSVPDRKVPSSGNRRNPRVHSAIIKTTLNLLKTLEYSALTIEAIAAGAGVGKATVYRWWPSKGALVAEAISSLLTVSDPPDTNDLRSDLIAAVGVSIQNYAGPPGGVLVTALAADLADDRQLLESFIESFVAPRRTVVRELIGRAAEEGLLTGEVDAELLMDMWAGAVIYRCLMKHQPIEPNFAAKLVDAITQAPVMHSVTK